MHTAPRVLLLLALALPLPPLLAGCGRPEDDGRLAVAVSVLPHAGLVERIGGDRVRAVPLVRPGESPATHQPTDAQVTEVLRAPLYFRCGVPFERGAWLAALERAPSVRVIDLREGMTLREIEAHDCGDPSHDHGHHDHGHDDHGHDEALDALGGEADPRTAAATPAHPDPHIWTSPRALAVQARAIARALEEVDPEGADAYAAGLEAVLADLEALDAELERILAPVKGKTVYVFHPAWGFLTDAYGLGQRAIEVSGKEPSESELTDLVRAAREDGVRAIFVQRQFSGATAEAVADALGAKVVVVDPLGRDVFENLREVARTFAGAL